jgi:hypothetical protein
MPDNSDDEVNEVVVLVPEDAGTSAANPSDSGSATEEIIDAVLDPLGAVDNSPDASATPGEVVEEVVVVEPADSSGTGDTGTVTDQTDTTSAGSDEPVGVVEPAADSPSTGDDGTATDPAEVGDLTGTGTTSGDSSDTGAGDMTAGIDSTDPDAASADPDAQAATDAATSDQAAADQAVADGDYATAAAGRKRSRPGRRRWHARRLELFRVATIG